MQDGLWVTSSDYKNANPDPLRNSAGEIVNEINTNNREDVHRFCNVYVDLDFQVHIHPFHPFFLYNFCSIFYHWLLLI